MSPVIKIFLSSVLISIASSHNQVNKGQFNCTKMYVKSSYFNEIIGYLYVNESSIVPSKDMKIEIKYFDANGNLNPYNMNRANEITGMEIKDQEIFHYPRVIENFKNLKILKIANSKLKHIYRENFEKLANLTYLDLSGNQLEISDRKLFYNIMSIKVLILDNNNISSIEVKALENLRNLDHFGFENNYCYSDTADNKFSTSIVVATVKLFCQNSTKNYLCKNNSEILNNIEAKTTNSHKVISNNAQLNMDLTSTPKTIVDNSTNESIDDIIQMKHLIIIMLAMFIIILILCAIIFYMICFKLPKISSQIQSSKAVNKIETYAEIQEVSHQFQKFHIVENEHVYECQNYNIATAPPKGQNSEDFYSELPEYSGIDCNNIEDEIYSEVQKSD